MTAEGAAHDWFRIRNEDEVESPALLIYPNRVDENIRRMVAIAGGPARLRPHVKTHKLREIATRKMAAGIRKFKAATIAEAEMLGHAGAADVLLAYQPVGPNARRFLELQEAFPGTAFSCLLDDVDAARDLSRQAVSRQRTVDVLLDLDCGQHRTGVPPDGSAFAVYEALFQLRGLKPAGLHAYDGHISHNDSATRKSECDAAFLPVNALRQQLQRAGLAVPTVVAGGTPTFAIHAQRPDVECSPGTCVLWDHGYGSRLLDLEFLNAALVLTRVVSKPGHRRLCLDLGHKSIASENPHPRVHFLNEPSAESISHSEEHLVVETEAAGNYKVGDCWYGVPRHICPTVALYDEAVVIEQSRAMDRWKIEARRRHLRW
jgi:D-serine deaminase-like pyridoxal phosphate-dependent protein